MSESDLCYISLFGMDHRQKHGHGHGHVHPAVGGGEGRGEEGCLNFGQKGKSEERGCYLVIGGFPCKTNSLHTTAGMSERAALCQKVSTLVLSRS